MLHQEARQLRTKEVLFLNIDFDSGAHIFIGEREGVPTVTLRGAIDVQIRESGQKVKDSR
jgi:hypothetical protein